MSRSRLTRVAAAVGTAALTFVLIRSLARPDPAPTVPPPAIVGTWVTDDVRYADRAFVVRRDTLEVHVGPGEASVHPIRAVEVVAAADHTSYEILYVTAEGEASLELLLYEDVVRLRNPPDVRWRRVAPPR